MLLAAGPGRVRLRIDIEMQRIPGLAPGGARGELGTVGHDHFDGMVIGMRIGLHGVVGVFPALFKGRLAKAMGFEEIWRLYNAPMTPRQADAAVICNGRPALLTPHCQKGRSKGIVRPTQPGGAELSMNLRA
jgi:hypothetical protein